MKTSVFSSRKRSADLRTITFTYGLFLVNFFLKLKFRGKYGLSLGKILEIGRYLEFRSGCLEFSEKRPKKNRLSYILDVGISLLLRAKKITKAVELFWDVAALGQASVIQHCLQFHGHGRKRRKPQI